MKDSELVRFAAAVFDASILEPNFHLFDAKAKTVGQLYALVANDVLVTAKGIFQLVKLLLGENSSCS